MKGLRPIALLVALSFSGSGCWTGKSRAESYSEQIEAGMTADEVLSRLGPPDTRGREAQHGVVDPGVTVVWTYKTQTSECYRIGWVASFFSVILTIPSLFFFEGIYVSEYFCEIQFGNDSRVIKKAVWTYPQF